MRIDLFVIDGQNDFCDPNGALHVLNADVEAQNIADMLERLEDSNSRFGHKIAKIHATLDSHHRLDGAHNIAWKDGSTGQIAPPFTIVSHQDILDQKFVPSFNMGVWEGQAITSLEWARKYTKALEDYGRNPLCLWPPHCEIGKPGQNVYRVLSDAYDKWCDVTKGWINWISKGQWVWTEHYSAIKADVPDPTRSETQLNAAVVNDAANADMILWTGWAGNFCLKWTARDAVNMFGDKDNEFVKKSVFLTDACAPVTHPDTAVNDMFIKDREDFLQEMEDRGATLTTTSQVLT